MCVPGAAHHEVVRRKTGTPVCAGAYARRQGRITTGLGYLKQIDGMLAGKEWLCAKYSVLDPYGFVFYT